MNCGLVAVTFQDGPVRHLFISKALVVIVVFLVLVAAIAATTAVVDAKKKFIITTANVVECPDGIDDKRLANTQICNIISEKTYKKEMPNATLVKPKINNAMPGLSGEV